MVESFTDFQRRMWLTLANFGVCRYYIDVTDKGRYVIKTGRLGVILFWVLWTNNASKFIYHMLTYHGLLGVEVHFLDQMSIWDWLLMYWHVFIECMVWFFKYPMWENLYRQWELQEEIYRKLGKPVAVAKKITRTDRMNFVIYGGVCIVGTFALAVQFFTTPKYALNTYAIIPADTLPLRIIFCIHECLFMCHGYAYQAFTMVLAEAYAVSYQHLLEEMNKALGSIIAISAGSNEDGDMILDKTPFKKASNDSTETIYHNNSKPVPVSKINMCRLSSKPVNPNITAPGTEYDIKKLLHDYKRVMISAQFHNQWIGMVMGIPEGINYGQFVSDVFMLIQLLKEAETDYFGVFFYIMDAAFGMVMIFRMLILLSRLYPQGEEFIRGLKIYASLNTPLRKELVKTIPSLRVVSAKLTGYSIRPKSVPVGINVLINWYICAAMWKRPDDPSRRT
ncbi:unnamed protein product [Orchesella dallaii]|uniref:Odorant receptor n=1 Tax=Orchesella dallaii TaxID=48710 RepID=A0ABP1RCF8_9HEXA